MVSVGSFGASGGMCEIYNLCYSIFPNRPAAYPNQFYIFIFIHHIQVAKKKNKHSEQLKTT